MRAGSLSSVRDIYALGLVLYRGFHRFFPSIKRKRLTPADDWSQQERASFDFKL
jgi:hypothetical protein